MQSQDQGLKSHHNDTNTTLSLSTVISSTQQRNSVMHLSLCYLPTVSSLAHSHCHIARHRAIFTCTAGCVERTSLDLTSTCVKRVNEQSLQALRELYERFNSTVHRGRCAHELGRLATEELHKARESVATTIGVADANDVVFAEDSTSAMSLVANAVCSTLYPQDEILVAVNCSDATMRSWRVAASARPLTVRVVPGRLASGSMPDIGDYGSLLGPRTRVIVLPVVCPVTAAVSPLSELEPFFKGIGAITVLDATSFGAQYALFDINSSRFSFAVFDAVNFSAPNGAFIFGKQDIWERMPPVLGGEHALEECSLEEPSINITDDDSKWTPVPDRFESISSSLSVAISIAPALQAHISQLSDGLAERAASLSNYLHSELSSVDGLIVYSNVSNVIAPYACFNVEDVEPDIIRKSLEDRGIYTEFGQIGLRVAHDNGVSRPSSIRVTLDPSSHSEMDIDRFIGALTESLVDIFSASTTKAASSS